jgi:hypothetical protein
MPNRHLLSIERSGIRVKKERPFYLGRLPHLACSYNPEGRLLEGLDFLTRRWED